MIKSEILLFYVFYILLLFSVSYLVALDIKKSKNCLIEYKVIIFYSDRFKCISMLHMLISCPILFLLIRIITIITAKLPFFENVAYNDVLNFTN